MRPFKCFDIRGNSSPKFCFLRISYVYFCYYKNIQNSNNCSEEQQTNCHMWKEAQSNQKNAFVFIAYYKIDIELN